MEKTTNMKTLFILILFSVLPSLVLAEEPDWTNYNQLLKQHVHNGKINGISLAQVDYQAIKADQRWPLVVDQIANYPKAKLTTQDQQLAFYINAYNILAIKIVLDHWPVKGIKDIGSIFSPVWKKTAGKAAQQSFSLGDLEHKVIRKFGEPRIHMAIVCASVSCPDLLNEAYTASKLDAQLTRQTRVFLANQSKGLQVKNKGYRVSKIFDWFEEDFEDSHGSIERFIQMYVPDIPKKDVDDYFDYDWSLNNTNNS